MVDKIIKGEPLSQKTKIPREMFFEEYYDSDPDSDVVMGGPIAKTSCQESAKEDDGLMPLPIDFAKRAAEIIQSE